MQSKIAEFKATPFVQKSFLLKKKGKIWKKHTAKSTALWFLLF